MTFRATFITLSLLVAAAQPLRAQPPGLEAHNASNAYVNCLVRTAQEIDDGHSNADTVGKSVQASCISQQRRLEDVLTAKLSGAQKRDFSEKLKAQTAIIATQTVMKGRELGN